MAILGLGTPSAIASNGCDSAEALLVGSVSGRQFNLTQIKSYADAYKKCLSKYADSYNSSNPYTGGAFFSLFTNRTVIQSFNRTARKAMADYRMSLLSEPSTINPTYSLSDCDLYTRVIEYGLYVVGDVSLASYGQNAYSQCFAMYQVKNDRARLIVQRLEPGDPIGVWAKWPTDVQLSYAWYRGTQEISGQRDKQYVLTNLDIGSTISVKVTGSRYGLISATHTSPPSGIVKQSTPAPVVTPTPTPVVTPKPVVTPTPTPVVTPKPVVTPTPTPLVAPTPTAAVNQATLTISSATTTHLASSTQWAGLTTTGGSGTGAVTYTTSGTGCSISGQLLKSEVATICTVIATKAASTGYNAITSAPKRFEFVMFNQDPLNISNKTFTNVPGTSITLTTTGGTGMGAVTYTTSGTGCSVSGSTLRSSTTGTCVVTATKSASTGYYSTKSTPVSFIFANASQAAPAPINQASFNISNTVLTSITGSSINLTTSGGSGTGAVSYSVSGSGCSISGSSLNSSVAATCVVTATKAASTGYNSTTSTTKNFVFVLPNPTPAPVVTPTPTPTPVAARAPAPVVTPTLNTDTQAPTFVSGSLTPQSVEVCTSLKSASARLTDNVGVTSATLRILAPNGSVIATFGAGRTEGSSTSGTYANDWVAPCDAALGQYRVEVQAKDAANNTSPWTSLGVFQVIAASVPDTSAPIVLSGNISQTSVTVCKTITQIRAQIKDDSRITNVSASLVNSAGQTAYVETLFLISGTASDGSFANSMTVPCSLTARTYSVRIQATDQTGKQSASTNIGTIDVLAASVATPAPVVTPTPTPVAAPAPAPAPVVTPTVEVLAAPVISSTFAKRDSIKVDFVAVSGITYKLDLLNSSGALVRTVCSACAPSNLISALTPSTAYGLRLTATKSTQVAVTERSVTTYASLTLAPTISSLTRANKLYTASFNPQSGWSYRLQTITGGCSGTSPLSTTSPIVWINPNAGTACRVALFAEDIYGNSGATTLPDPTILDNAAPSAALVSVTPGSITGSGTIAVTSRGTDDVAVLNQVIYVKNAAGTTVATTNRYSTFQNGTDTEQVFATSISIPAGLPAGTYSIAAQTSDWIGKTSTINIGTITIAATPVAAPAPAPAPVVTPTPTPVAAPAPAPAPVVDQDPLIVSTSTTSRLVSQSFTLVTAGGSGSGTVSFATTSPGCVISGTTLTTTNTAETSTCAVIATKAASIGYNVRSSAAKTFTFTKP